MTERAVGLENDSRSSEPRQGVHSPRLPVITRAATVLVALGGLALTNAACNNQEKADPATQLPTETATLTLEPSSTQEPENPFGFTIPEKTKTLAEALDFVKSQEVSLGHALVDNQEIKISFHVTAIPEQRQPDIDVLVKSADNKRKIQAAWANNLRILFDRWDICSLDINWDSTPLNPAVDDDTPGCKQNVK